LLVVLMDLYLFYYLVSLGRVIVIIPKPTIKSTELLLGVKLVGNIVFITALSLVSLFIKK
jgi:hypothetical protein